MHGKRIYVGWKKKKKTQTQKLVLGWGVKRDRNEFHV